MTVRVRRRVRSLLFLPCKERKRRGEGETPPVMGVLARAEAAGMPLTERRWRRIRGLAEPEALALLVEMSFT